MVGVVGEVICRITNIRKDDDDDDDAGWGVITKAHLALRA